jgi:hypothetical protein
VSAVSRPFTSERIVAKADKAVLEGLLRPGGDELEVDVTTFADRRGLGMTRNGWG